MTTDAALATLANESIHRRPLGDDALGEVLAVLGARWSVVGPDLVLTLAGSMTRTTRAAAFAGALADELDHHPSIEIEYAGLTLAIHTHDAKAITGLDVTYAARVEIFLRENLDETAPASQ